MWHLLHLCDDPQEARNKRVVKKSVVKIFIRVSFDGEYYDRN